MSTATYKRAAIKMFIYQDERERLRLAAHRAEVPMTEIVRRALQDYFEKHQIGFENA